jgi:hypothetical protein
MMYVGKIVLYHARSLAEPCAAIVTHVALTGSVNATVFMDGGRSYPVFGLSATPTGKNAEYVSEVSRGE